MKKILVRHIGNMGDMIFFIPPVLESLKKKYPESHITFVTAWGFKETKRSLPTFSKKEHWGNRNQSGFSIHLMMTDPNIDQLVHWHDTKTSLAGDICVEDGQHFPTWSEKYYEAQKKSGGYDDVFELDFGIGTSDNPMQRMYDAIGMSEESYADYKIHFTNSDKKNAAAVMKDIPRPRIVLLEGIEGTTTRGWDPRKVIALERLIEKKYKVPPMWFGAKHAHFLEGRPLTLRENIATLLYCDIAIGVMSGPMHFAAAAGLPTITLFCDQPLHRAAPAYFLNEYVSENAKKHRTILGPSNPMELKFLKDGTTAVNLTPSEFSTQGYQDWQNPGRQSTKSCLSVITPDEVLAVLEDALPSR